MGLVKDWRRQAARAMGVSLIAPVALLVAAVIVAAGGGGFGGLGSLGQISSGPTLSDVRPVSSPRASLDEAQLATAGLATGTAFTPGGSAGAPTGGAAPVTGNGILGAGGGPGDTITPGPGTPGSRPPLIQQPPAGGAPAGGTPPVSAPPAPVSPPAANPIDDVLDTTRELGESLPAPSGPTTGEIVDSLLGPRQ